MNTTIPEPNPVTTTILLGVSTAITQALLLREAMAAMGGSEMAWGLVMALWLAGMGAGSRIGVRIGSVELARRLPLITLVLGAGGVLLFRAASAILGAAPGETLTTWHAVWLWALAVVPAAIAGGMAFPVLAGELGRNGPGRAYAIEAAGALLGGVAISLALISLGTAAAFILTIGVVGGVTLWPRHPAAAAALVVACLSAAIPAGHLLARASWRWAGHPGALGSWAETRHQRLDCSRGSPTELYANGRLVASYPDPYLVRPRTHLLMLLHPAPEKVLAVGALSDGSVEAMLSHPVETLLVVDEDPELVDLLPRWYGEEFRIALSSSAVRISDSDPLRALDSVDDLDLVILTDGSPTTLRANRTRTIEFLRRCRKAMSSGGVLVMRVGVSDTYLGGTGGRLVATLANTLHKVFPKVASLPGDEILLLAGGLDANLDTGIQTLEARLSARLTVLDEFPAAMLPALVDHNRRIALATFIESMAPPPNTIRHPRAVALASRLHEARSRQGRGWLAATIEDQGRASLSWGLVAVVAALLATAILGRRDRSASAAAFVVGFTSMGWWLFLLAIWQTTRGSVYAEVGALTGLFMAGAAAGGWASHRHDLRVRALGWLIAAGAGLSLIVATGAPAKAPLALVPGLLVVGGILTGATFPGLGELAGRGSSRRGAGLAFAADELGAAAAALTIGTVAIPWVGMTATAIGLAVMGLAAIPAIVRA